MTEEVNIFESDDPANPTVNDVFKMDLTATLGYKSVANMLESVDAWEYEFWFEYYKKNCFGPSMVNYMLAQVSFYVDNCFSKSNSQFSDYVMKVSEDNTEDNIINVTCNKYHSNMRKWLKGNPTIEALKGQHYTDKQIERIKKGFKETPEDYKELNNLAKIVSDKYRKGLEERNKEENAFN